MEPVLNLSSGPHIRTRWNTQNIMLAVAAALLPTAVVGVINHGLHALFVILVSVVTAVGTEFLWDKLTHKGPTWLDGSALITGLVLALTLSPSVPLYLPVIGAFFAIFVAKLCFGGLGKNFVNPAIAGRIFLLLSFGKAMSTFAVDGVSSATPVSSLISGKTVNVSQMFLGTSPGVIGNSVAAVLAGGMILWALGLIHGEICFSVLGGFSLIILLFGGQGFDMPFLLAHLCGGGVVMGAFFMATDYITSPISRLGKLLYGLMIGVLGGIFRLYGTQSDSFSYSIIIGNLFTPFFDMYIIQQPYSYRVRALRKRRIMAGRRPFWKKIPKAVVALGVITLAAGVALSSVFSMTKENIEEQKRLASEKAYRAVCPAAVHFEHVPQIDLAVQELDGEPYDLDFGRVFINEAMVGRDGSGAVAGYVISLTTADGNDGDISLALGIQPDGTVYGISFTELNETPGMGMHAGEPAFMDQFAGKNVTRFELTKNGAVKENEIDAISGATVTSDAVTNAVNAGLGFYLDAMKGVQ